MSNSIPCPCCQKVLYETAAIDEHHMGKVNGPELKQSDNRLFMICPNCENEIDFIGSGQLSPSPIQPCSKGKQ